MSAYREHALQTTCAAYLRRALPPDAAWTSVDPATDQHMDVVAGARRRARGILAGWPDMQVLWGGGFYGIELKIPGGRMSENQLLRAAEIKQAGGMYAVCYSVEDVERTLRGWGITLKATTMAAGEYDIRREARMAAPKKPSKKPRGAAASKRALKVAASAQRPRGG